MGISTITKDQLPEVLEGIAKMKSESLLVGIPEAETERGGSQVTNAQIGYWMEYGSPARNIPARPWLVPGVKAAEPRTSKQFKKAGQDALRGDTHAYAQRINDAGLEAVSVIKNRIVAGIGQPLANATLHKRKTRKESPHEGETPLIDTGQFLNSITYTIKDHGEGDVEMDDDA